MSSGAQVTKNTKWIRLFDLRKNGSHVTKTDASFWAYPQLLNFSEDTASRPSPEMISIPSKRVWMGRMTFSLDHISDTTLSISDFPPSALPDDKANRVVYINEKFYLDYIVKKKLLDPTGDTLRPSVYLSYYWRGVEQDLSRGFGGIKRDGVLYGTLIVSATGKVAKVTVKRNEGKLKDEQVNKFITFLSAIENQWAFTSYFGKPLKIEFACAFTNGYPNRPIKVKFHVLDQDGVHSKWQ